VDDRSFFLAVSIQAEEQKPAEGQGEGNDEHAAQTFNDGAQNRFALALAGNVATFRIELVALLRDLRPFRLLVALQFDQFLFGFGP
jgi:hypothetical protein